MIHSIAGWNFARSPNYTINVDKVYPYSEVPYIGNYKLVKIPTPNTIAEHVDFWGEGKIQTQQGVSGFPDCYNVNHQYQLVSNGPDRDKKIPNRIPTISYINCDTSSYIKDNSVKLVTLMGAPVNKSCAKDMSRMLHSETGKVVIFGINSSSADAKNLDEELKKRNVFYCDGYALPEYLKSVTLFDGLEYLAYLNVTDLSEELYKNITTDSLEYAYNITKILDTSNNGERISTIIKRLLNEGNKNLMTFAYKVSNSEAKDILIKYFNIVFKLIFMGFNTRIINKMHLFALKMDENKGIKTEGVVKAEDAGKANEKSLWRFVPISENGELYFKILNLELGMFLALEDDSGVRTAKGVLKDTGISVQWALEPIKVNDDILFYLTNRKFKQGLKLEENVDASVERAALGHDGSVQSHPETFGWFIKPQ